MIRPVQIITASFICFFLSSPCIPQEKKYNDLYKPLPLVKRLSYENFKNIKLLQTAIINFGGGEGEIERLIDQYADASALYFQNRIEESANKFSENERAILKVSKDLAGKYKTDSEALLINAIKLNIKTSIQRSLKGKKRNESADKFLRNAQFGVQKGNDYYVRYKDASTAPPGELISSIYYFRRAKENIFLMYEASDIDESEKRAFLEQHKKDIDDNNNTIYQSKEKSN